MGERLGLAVALVVGCRGDVPSTGWPKQQQFIL